MPNLRTNLQFLILQICLIGLEKKCKRKKMNVPQPVSELKDFSNMRVDRENLLRALESVTAGLAHREIIEQSGSFVFKDGNVITFNDEIACTATSPLKIQGA